VICQYSESKHSFSSTFPNVMAQGLPFWSEAGVNVKQKALYIAADP